MEITNNYNLPEEYVRAVGDGEGHATVPLRYSVTEIVQPAWITYLRRKYPNCKEDASMRISRALGLGLHLLLEKQDTNEYFHEVKFEERLDKYTIVGRLDRMKADGTEVYDYKTCKYAKIGKGDFSDWDRQGLMYCWLLWKAGFHPQRYTFYAFAVDWSPMKLVRQVNTEGYVPVYKYTKEVNESELEVLEAWIKVKLDKIERGDVSPCTPEERWTKSTIYAVKQTNAKKRTIKLFSSKEEAEKFMEDKKDKYDMEIETRRGESTRCLYYCPFSSYCKEEKSKNGKSCTDCRGERSWEDSLPPELR